MYLQGTALLIQMHQDCLGLHIFQILPFCIEFVYKNHYTHFHLNMQQHDFSETFLVQVWTSQIEFLLLMFSSVLEDRLGRFDYFQLHPANRIYRVSQKKSGISKIMGITSFKYIRKGHIGGVLENSGYLLPDGH